MHHPPDTRAEAPSAGELRNELNAVLRSTAFATSELLRNLLSFLVQRATDHPGEPVREYDVAVSGLGRPSGFDPRLDSAVRVHAARLRSKLAEYYVADGAEDRVIISIPKGAYLINAHYRSDPAAPLPAPSVLEPPPIPVVPASRRSWRWLGAVAVVVLLGLGVLVWRPFSPKGVSPAINAFWRPFTESAQGTLVVFSNPRLAGSSASGLHAFREGVDSPSDINETYSGTGTVMAVYNLTHLFSAFARPIRLKRAELLTWDEVQNANVVFAGGPESDTRLREFPTLKEFAFKSSREEPRFGTGGIVNLQPRAGEQSTYFSSGRPYTSDYAIIAMLPGLKPQNRVLLLAGTNTYGVEAAADFVTREDLTASLLSRLGVSGKRPLPDFEALLEVKISGGVPVQSKLLLVRPR